MRVADGTAVQQLQHVVVAKDHPVAAFPPDRAEGRRLYGADPGGYADGRPGYPERVYDLLAESGLRRGCRVVEIGPGTGLVTRRLLAAGARVTAVEASPAMAEYLQRTCGQPGLEIVGRPFEEAGLPGDAYDLAVAATSYHWVAQPAGGQALTHALRPGARAVIWWMLFDDPASPDAFDTASQAVLGGSPTIAPGAGPVPFQADMAARMADMTSAGLADVTGEIVRSGHLLTAMQVRRLYATLAIVLRRPGPEQAQLLDRLEQLVRHRFGGSVRRTFVTAIYRGHKPASVPGSRSSR
jgi:SAM-dependent methyltransferase